MRLFIALPLPPEIAVAAAALVPVLPGLRPVPAALLHLTLAFLGSVPDERVPDVIAACAGAAKAHAPFDIVLDRAGRFPEGGAPRVVWLGLGEGAAESADLAASVRRELSARGLAFDDRPFRPHVTLARVRPGVDRIAAGVIAAAVERLRPKALRFAAESIVAMESLLSPRGPRYRPRAVVPLAR